MTTDRHPGIIYPWRISELHPLLFVGSVPALPTKANYITSSPALSNRQGGLFSCPHFRPKSTLFDKKRQKKTLDQIRQKSTKNTNLAANPKKPSIPCGARVSGQFRVCQRFANPSTPLKPLRRKGFGVFSGFASRGTSLPLGGGRSTPQGSTPNSASPF